MASRLPAKAAGAVIQKPPAVSTMAPTAPSAPPAVMPIRPGSASGLRNSACMAAPDTAKPPRHHGEQHARQADVDQHIAPQHLIGRGLAPEQRRQRAQRNGHGPLALAASTAIASARQISATERAR